MMMSSAATRAMLVWVAFSTYWESRGGSAIVFQ